jgi:5-methylcytosine-specific restriction endonuclease McrA
MEYARTFTVRLADLLARERAALGDFLVALASFDDRKLWVELEYASLFDFLHRELRLSRGAAFYRKTAVELIHRFPEVVAPLRDGRLCLMTVAEVSRVLTEENRAEVLPRFFGLSKREAQALAAELQPTENPPMRAVVTPVRAPAPAAHALTTSVARPQLDLAQPAVQPVERELPESTEPVRRASASPPSPAAVVQPLTAELNRYHVTVSRRFLEKLEAATAALSHSHPNGAPEEILEAGLDLLLDRAARRRAVVKRPRPVPRPSSNPDYVPAHVRRAVWERDGGRCQYRLASGEICGSTGCLEIDHIVPLALGGPSTEENCRLACDTHNDRAARRVLGDACMDRFTRNPRARPTALQPDRDTRA